jgi:hypothetical protein
MTRFSNRHADSMELCSSGVRRETFDRVCVRPVKGVKTTQTAIAAAQPGLQKTLRDRAMILFRATV